MNIAEFAALKVGDKITNPSLGTFEAAEIVETSDRGVSFRWDGTPVVFFAAANSTLWHQWVEADEAQQPE